MKIYFKYLRNGCCIRNAISYIPALGMKCMLYVYWYFACFPQSVYDYAILPTGIYVILLSILGMIAI